MCVCSLVCVCICVGACVLCMCVKETIDMWWSEDISKELSLSIHVYVNSGNQILVTGLSRQIPSSELHLLGHLVGP